MSAEYKLSHSDRISNIATLSRLITEIGCWNVTEEMEQNQAPNLSLANDETKEISRFNKEICVSESDIQVMLQDPFSFRKPFSLKVDFGHFLESLSSNSAAMLYHDLRSFPSTILQICKYITAIIVAALFPVLRTNNKLLIRV